MVNKMVTEMVSSMQQFEKPTNVIIRMEPELHQKLKLYTTLNRDSIQNYVVKLIEYDLEHNDFSKKQFSKQNMDTKNVKNLILRLEPNLHQTLKILVQMFHTSLQQYILGIIVEDLKSKKII